MTNNELELSRQPYLSIIRDNAKLAVEKVLEANPTREQLGDFLAEIANHYCLEINQTAVWELVNETHKFEVDEFYNDMEELVNKHGEEVLKYGQRNWKLK